MRKVIGIGALIVVILVLGVAVTALAHDPSPPSESPCPYGGTCGSYGMGGSGLGLRLPVVEAHGGRIWAESAAGRGSTFIVALSTLAGP
jgi:hypothetical protein